MNHHKQGCVVLDTLNTSVQPAKLQLYIANASYVLGLHDDKTFEL